MIRKTEFEFSVYGINHLAHNKFIYVVFVAIVSLLLFSNCENNHSKSNKTDGETVKRKYYEDGSLKSEGVYIQDSIKNGWHKKYYRSGTLKAKIFYDQGKQDSLTYWYYNNGQIKEKSHWLNGKQYGDIIAYYENGSKRIYNSLDYAGDPFYVIKWDSTGKKIKEEGMAYSHTHIVSNLPHDSIPVGEEFILQLTTSDPPQKEISVLIDDTSDQIKEVDTFQIDRNTASYSKTFESTGNYRWNIFSKIIDSRSNKVVKKDTKFLDLRVIDKNKQPP